MMALGQNIFLLPMSLPDMKKKKMKAQNELILSERQFEKLMELCENPPPPSKKILESAKKLDSDGFK